MAPFTALSSAPSAPSAVAAANVGAAKISRINSTQLKASRIPVASKSQVRNRQGEDGTVNRGTMASVTVSSAANVGDTVANVSEVKSTQGKPSRIPVPTKKSSEEYSQSLCKYKNSFVSSRAKWP